MLIPGTKTLIVLVGPTAVGKTAAAIKLAQHFKTAIISADSRQFYREMSIGTAKPTDEELSLVKHYFINSHSITESFNVGDFEQQGLATLNEIFAVHDVAIIAGGSGLYIKAICEGFDDLPPVKHGVRESLNADYQKNGIDYLQQKLQDADPDYFAKVDINNPQRIIRALEVIVQTGKTFSSFRTDNIKQRYFNIVKIGLNLPRDILYSRINHRVDVMMAQGLLYEVESLLPFRGYNALNTVGYSEIFNYLDADNDLPAAIALIKQNTRRFAKRQLTWFKKDKAIRWFDPLQLDAIIGYINE